MSTPDNRIKVFIRPRPLFANETEDIFNYKKDNISLKQPQKTSQSSFSFDRVFSTNTTTHEVFDATSKNIIENAVDGYNGTIIAYGQTTSGKTHTMIGNMHGIIPMSLTLLYNKLSSFEKCEFKIWISYMEIYNEVINDLLDVKSVNLRIREGASEGYFVPGLSQILCRSVTDALKVLENGEKQRTYRATNIHEHSSRSHSVFRILIERKNIEGVETDEQQKLHIKGSVRFSVVNLVDLAGSERISDVGGDNSETGFINKSLFVLTNVINKLSDSCSDYIPYRDSKLTRILSNSLGGNALTSIICTIAPDVNYMQLSLSTLRFAMRAKRIKNQPVVNEVVDDAAMIVTYKKKIALLEGQLATITSTKDAEIHLLKLQFEKLKDLPVSEAQECLIEEAVNLYSTPKSKSKTNLNFPELSSLVVGFDVQRARFEEQVECKKLTKWNEECSKLRGIYLIELASLDERYFGCLENLYNSMINTNKKQPPRPVQGSMHKAKARETMTPRQGDYKIRIQQANSTRVPVKTSVSVERKPTIVSPAPKYSKPIASLNPLKSRRNTKTVSDSAVNKLKASNSSMKSYSNDASEKVIPTNSFSITATDHFRNESPLVPSFDQESQIEALAKTNTDSFENKTLSPKSSEIYIPITKNRTVKYQKNSPDEPQDEIIYNPPPDEDTPLISLKPIECDLAPNPNTFLFGCNKDGSCGEEKNTSTKNYVNLEYEFTQVSCGYYHNALLTSKGVLFTMGKGTIGQLGTGKIENTHILSPVTHPLYNVEVSSVSCGWMHTLCISNGEVFAWGYNGEGQLGIGDYYDRSWPVHVEGIKGAISISAGFLHSAAATESKVVYCWGSNPDGRLFKDPVYIKWKVYEKEPRPIVIEIDGVSVACGFSHTLVLSPQGEVYSAGNTEHGQLGLGHTYESFSICHKIREFADGKAMKIGCHDRYSVVLTKDNELFTFGKGSFGRLGIGNEKDILQPVKIEGFKFVDFACGGRHMLGVDENSILYAWGYGFYYQLGTMTQDDYYTPQAVDFAGSTGKWAKKIACGSFHSAVITM